MNCLERSKIRIEVKACCGPGIQEEFVAATCKAASSRTGAAFLRGLFGDKLNGFGYPGGWIQECRRSHLKDVISHSSQEPEPSLHLGGIGLLSFPGLLLNLFDGLFEFGFIYVGIPRSRVNLLIDLGE